MLFRSEPLFATSQNAATISTISGGVGGKLDLGGSTTAAINVAPIVLNGQNVAPWQPTLYISSLLGNFSLTATAEMPISVTGGGVLSLGGQSVFSSDLTIAGGTGLHLNTSSTQSGVGTVVSSGPVGVGRLVLNSGALLLSGASANAIANAVLVKGDLTFGGFNNLALNGVTTLSSDSAHTLNVVVPNVSQIGRAHV